jgi:hypothetical protein
MAADGVDAYFGVRPEHMRYLTGFSLEDGEDRVAGHSGKFFISAEEVVVLADSRYRLQAVAQAPKARIEPTTYDLAAIWPKITESSGGSCRMPRRRSTWSMQRAGWRRIGPPRSRPKSSGSGRPAPSPTGRWQRS